MSEDQELAIRISELEKRIDGLYNHLRRASQFSSLDPEMALNRCRVVLERLIYKWYQNETHKTLERPLLGAMLNDKEFLSKIPRFILPKINYIKEYGNLGSHGEEIDFKTANDVIHKLLDVLEWFTNNPATEDILLQTKSVKGNTVYYIEILPQLKAEYPNCLIPEIEFVRFGQDEKACYLEIIFSKTIYSKGSDDTTTGYEKVYDLDRDDLSFICDDKADELEFILAFDPDNGLEENARKFISDLSVIANVTDLFTYKAAKKINNYIRKHGKYPILKRN
jgi:hypothetical protein